MREKLLDPTGTTERAVDTTLAPRLRTLRGLTAGLLENGKPNAAALLTETGRELQEQVRYQRLQAVPEELLRPSGRGEPDPADPA